MLLQTIPQLTQAADYSAPIILGNSQILPNSLTGEHEIYITVTDDRLVASVVLKYKKIGEDKPFSTISLPRVDFENNLYGTVLDDSFLSSIPNGIEYYLEATDTSNNVTQTPFPDQPHRLLSISRSAASITSSPVDTLSASKSSNKPFNIKKEHWLWITLGVVATGLVLSQSGGSSGSADQTSTVNITSPTPGSQ